MREKFSLPKYAASSAALHHLMINLTIPDRQRFLIGTMVGEANAPPVSVILNWTAEANKKMKRTWL